jgi:putative membrane protein
VPPAEPLSRDRYKQAVLLLFVAFFIGSCIAPPYPQYMLMQHAPTVVAAGALAYVAQRFAMSRFSFTAIVLFLSLHTLGARYLYSYTPYDDWSRALLGLSINELFGLERNHYDRFVHFSFGLLLAVPVQEFERRHLGLSLAVASVLAVECIVASSAVYEMIEWLVAVVFTPEYADQFLGQQGDIFDGQKDMALATCGGMIAIVVSLCAAATHRRYADSGRGLTHAAEQKQPISTT